ncbi:MAG TPA: DUF1232 domain-containing protein [Natronosporangium sp.]
MARTLSRTAAFVALWRQLRAANRDGPGLGKRLAALPRMISASLRRRGRYDGLGRLALMVAAAAYLVWPVELLPELLLGPAGLIDDAFVVAWLSGAVLSETGRFLDWERQREFVALPAWATRR